MPMMLRTTMALALLLAQAGCKDPAAKASAATTTSAAPNAEAHDAATKTDPARQLALAPAPGAGAVDMRITELQKGLEALPGKLDFWVLLGQAWIRKARETTDPGFYLNADACATVGLELAPGNKMPLNLHGLVLLNDHKFADARDLAQKVIALDPEDQFAYGTLSDALLELGQLDAAIDAAQKMVNMKPGLPSYTRGSYLKWLQGDSERAIAISGQAIDAGDPHDPEPLSWVLVQSAMIFWHRGDYAGADAGFDVAIKWTREYPPALVGKGRVAMAKGDARRAAELFGRAYDQSPLIETAWLLGDAREAAGDTAGAAKAFALVERFGKTTDPRTLSLYYSTKSIKAPDALSLAEAESKVRGDIYMDDVRGWAFYRNARFAEARKYADHALSWGTKDARLLYHAGQIHIASGDVTGGRKLIAEALALNPGFDATGSAEARRALPTEATRPGAAH